jgi:hypothetical protein
MVVPRLRDCNRLSTDTACWAQVRGISPSVAAGAAVSAERHGAPLDMLFRNATVPAAALLALALATTAGAATLDGPAIAALSSAKAGAKHVTLTVSLTTELQCGRLMGSRTLVVTLPAKAKVAQSIPAAAVLVGGKAASSVSVAGRAVTISLAAPHGMMCDSIRTGIVKVVLMPSAGFANPAAPGTYTVRVVHGNETFAAPLKVHS